MVALAALAFAGCQREERNFRPNPAFSTAAGRYAEEYEQNAYNLSEGKRLFQAFNCVGCHGHGGGGMGPPLIDARWFYGYEPPDIFTTISKGRPNGMPAFEKKVPAYQIWQLVAYVRSLSGQVRSDAAPGRDDDMKAQPPEHTIDRERPYVQKPDPDVVEPPKKEPPK